MKPTRLLPPLLAFVVSATAIAASNKDVERRHPLIGKWSWTRSTNQCTEVYEYHADGTYSSVSGDEHSEGVFKIAATPNEDGFFLYTDKVLKDHGGKDCGNSEEDITGAEATLYIAIHQSGEQILVCYEPSFDKCFGPLKRIREN